jgi:hypothetical protein
MASISIATGAAQVSHTEAPHHDTRDVRRIANFEVLLTLALLLAACVLHLA